MQSPRSQGLFERQRRDVRVHALGKLTSWSLHLLGEPWLSAQPSAELPAYLAKLG